MKRLRPSAFRPRARPLPSAVSSTRTAYLPRSFVIAASHPLPTQSSSISSTSTSTTSNPRRPSLLPRPNQQQPKTSLRHASTPTSSEAEPLRKTPLYDLHLSHGGKMVPFGGHHMPVSYASLSVSASHAFTRTHASLFDVSHMVQQRFSGAGATAFLQRATPADLVNLPVHQSTLSTLLWPGTGGIVDDTVITRLGPETFYVVTNAACREKDGEYFEGELERFRSESPAKGTEGLQKDVDWEILDGWGLVALQGPKAAEILEAVLSDPQEADLEHLYFGQSKFLRLKMKGMQLSSPVLVSRGGYTGEDGFEISIQPEETVAVTETLLDSAGPENLQLAGLGARDSLRLEAGMCLYGHDLDDTTTPVEAGLSWVIGKSRRASGSDSSDSFHGAAVILPQLTPKSKGGAGVSRRRVGLIVDGAPAREGAEIVDPSKNSEKIGKVTSGCPSPTLGKNIAMGYVKDGLHKAGTEVGVLVRGKERKAVVTKMPFVPARYYKAPPTTEGGKEGGKKVEQLM